VPCYPAVILKKGGQFQQQASRPPRRSCSRRSLPPTGGQSVGVRAWYWPVHKLAAHARILAHACTQTRRHSHAHGHISACAMARPKDAHALAFLHSRPRAIPMQDLSYLGTIIRWVPELRQVGRRPLPFHLARRTRSLTHQEVEDCRTAAREAHVPRRVVSWHGQSR
jgi:hypothetical protein